MNTFTYHCQAITKAGRACRCRGVFCVVIDGEQRRICKLHFNEIARWSGAGLPFRVAPLHGKRAEPAA